MDLDQIKKQINEIFKKENIKHVFYVDDRVDSFGKKKQLLFALIRKKADFENDQQLIEILKASEIDTTDDPELILKNLEEKFSVDNLTLVNSLLDHFELHEPIKKEDEDNNAFDIEKYFNQGQFSALEPAKAIETITKKLRSFATERVLVLFDLDLAEAGGEFAERTTGVELLIRLMDNDPNNQCVCSIFTHLVKSTAGEIEERRKLILNSSGRLNKSNLFVLAKKRKNDAATFGDGIKKAILNPHYEKVKEHTVNLISTAFDKSKEELKGIDTYEFDHIVLHSSNIEGVWAGETLLRILNILFEKNVKDAFIADKYQALVNPFFEKAIKLAKTSFPSDLREIPEINRHGIRNLELYTPGYILNKSFEPINNGDIFEVQQSGAVQTYVLVAQECDIILRSDGKRNRKNDFFTLLKVDFKSKEEIETDIQNFTRDYGLKNYYYANKFLLKNYNESDPNIIGVVDFRNELMIYATILDLTSFNEDGTAKFNAANTYPLQSFCQALRNRHKNVELICKKKVDELNQIDQDFQQQNGVSLGNLLQKFVETASPTNPLVGNPYPYMGGAFDFGIRRKSRLKTLWATQLLEKYGYYLSRGADLSDYTEHIDPKNLRLN